MIGSKLRPTATPDQARRFLDKVLAPLRKVMPSAALYRRALDLQAHWHFSFYDSMIVAAGLESHCTRIFSEDLQHGQRIESLVIENPFAG